MSGARKIAYRPHSCRRPFSSTGRRRADHYETLSLPRSATRSQIKTRFYKLSKDLHPDLNPSREAKAKYLKVSEAYNTLGDDKRRREYDQTLHSHASYTSHSHSASGPPPSWAYHDVSKRRGATYAWEHTHRSRPAPGPGYARADPRSTGQHYTRYNDFTRHGAYRRRTATSSTEGEDSRERQVSNESLFWRVVQVFGVVWLVVAIGGGWSAHT